MRDVGLRVGHRVVGRRQVERDRRQAIAGVVRVVHPRGLVVRQVLGLDRREPVAGVVRVGGQRGAGRIGDAGDVARGVVRVGDGVAVAVRGRRQHAGGRVGLHHLRRAVGARVDVRRGVVGDGVARPAAAGGRVHEGRRVVRVGLRRAVGADARDDAAGGVDRAGRQLHRLGVEALRPVVRPQRAQAVVRANGIDLLVAALGLAEILVLQDQVAGGRVDVDSLPVATLRQVASDGQLAQRVQRSQANAQAVAADDRNHSSSPDQT